MDSDFNISRSLFSRRNETLEQMFPTLKFHDYKTKSCNHYISIKNRKKYFKILIFDKKSLNIFVCMWTTQKIMLRWNKNVSLKKNNVLRNI